MILNKYITKLFYKKPILCSFILLVSCGKANKNNNINSISERKEISIRNKNNTLKWELPELSQEEKENLISSVKTVFNDYYVNRLQKIKDYNYDALKEANKLDIVV